jgi:diguanylate cyclase
LSNQGGGAVSEVLSDSSASRAVDSEAFLEASERQKLRFGRFLMAAGTSFLVCVALFLCAFLELLPLQAAIEGSAGIVTLVLVFFVLFRSGINKRFADASLTTEQVGSAIVFLAYIMYHAGPARNALTLFYLVAMLFGVLRLNTSRLMMLALLALLSHATVLHLTYLRDPLMDTRAALTEFAVLIVVLPWFAAMGGYVNRLRVRLSDSHRKLQGAYGRIEQLAIRDELTGAYNRRHLMETLARERSRAQRLRTPLCVCVLDIDHFKTINDTLGHAGGDVVLKHFAQLGPRMLRTIDTFGRFGGEEFLLILPDTTLQGARALADRLRVEVEQSAFPGVPAERPVRVTIGVAQSEKGEDVQKLLARADAALYRGKSAGRNRVMS